MRFNRFIVISLFVFACKPTQVTTSTAYREDLSVHRLEFPAIDLNETPQAVDEVIENDVAVYYPNEITRELDSVNQLILASNLKRKYWDGYIIQVYRGDSRSDAYTIRDNMEEFFPDLKAEVTYYQPTYRVNAGQFFDRMKATRKYQEVLALYPRALLLPEKLPLPKSDGAAN